MEAQIFSLYCSVRIANSNLQLILMMSDYRFDDEDNILIIFNETNRFEQSNHHFCIPSLPKAYGLLFCITNERI